MSEVAIRVENLSKIYRLYDKPIDRMKEALSLSRKNYHKNHYALNRISFEVNKGETIGIIGRNGSGKSTLLKIITGVLNPSEGKVDVKGKISALLELGAGFNPEYTGVENIYLNGTLMGYSMIEMDSKIDNILDFADIGEFINQPVKSYSSGMFARLAFSVAINVEPEILIVDEALSVGDVFFQNKCFKKFDELKKSGVTILFVSHDISSVKQMCSKVLWIEHGEYKQFGNAKSVCGNFQNTQFACMNEENRKLVDRMKSDEIDKIYSDDNIFIPKIVLGEQDILSDKVEIIAFFIRNKSGNIITTIQTGGEYEVNMLAKFNQDIDNSIFGFIAENNKGINVLGINTFLTKNNKTIKCKKNEVMNVVFNIEFPKIAKGEYLLSPAIAEGSQSEHVMLTWLHNNMKITVENEGYNLSILDIDTECTIKSYELDNIKFIN